MEINKLISPYNHSSRKGRKIEWIVIHYVGGLGGAKDNCQYYAGGDRQASELLHQRQQDLFYIS